MHPHLVPENRQLERDQPAKRAGLLALARFSLSVSRGKCPVAIHATARSAASSLSLARRCGFDENTNQSDKGMIATSNAAPATNAADGDP